MIDRCFGRAGQNGGSVTCAAGLNRRSKQEGILFGVEAWAVLWLWVEWEFWVVFFGSPGMFGNR